MNLELQRRLFSTYPLLFRKPGRRLYRYEGEGAIEEALPGLRPDDEDFLEDDDGPLDYWGIECGDGWYALIDRVCAQAEAETRLLAASGMDRGNLPRVCQIKEKFGVLVLAMPGASALSAEVQAMLNAVEKESAATCEDCGQPGELRTGGDWLHVSCDACELRMRSIPSTDPMHDYMDDLKALLDARPA